MYKDNHFVLFDEVLWNLRIVGLCLYSGFVQPCMNGLKLALTDKQTIYHTDLQNSSIAGAIASTSSMVYGNEWEKQGSILRILVLEKVKILNK